MVKTGQAWAGSFVTQDATGALATPSVGPAGVLYVDGVANGASVTITGSNPYKFAVTLPTLTAGQRVDMYITATISTIATAGIVASEQADTVLVSDVKAETVLILEDTGTTLPASIAEVMAWAAAAIAAGYTAGSVSQIRGNSWDIDMTGMTLDTNKQQLMIKRKAQDPDADAILFVDSETGLLTLNGVSTGLTAGDAVLTYAGTTLNLTITDASITAQLPPGVHLYGAQGVTAAGLVAENYGGTWTIIPDIVQAVA